MNHELNIGGRRVGPGHPKFKDLPREHVDRFFGRWKDLVPIYRDYWSLIETNHVSRHRMFEFLDALVAAGKFRVTLRPHPSEDAEVYRQWLERLPAERKSTVTIDHDTTKVVPFTGWIFERAVGANHRGAFEEQTGSRLVQAGRG